MTTEEYKVARSAERCMYGHAKIIPEFVGMPDWALFAISPNKIRRREPCRSQDKANETRAIKSIIGRLSKLWPARSVFA